MGIEENRVQREVCEYLNREGWFAFRINNSAIYDQTRGAYRKPQPFQINGIADVCAIKDGRTIWIECKTKSGVQSDAQVLFEKAITNRGGEYLLIRSVEDLHEFFHVNRRAAS